MSFIVALMLFAEASVPAPKDAAAVKAQMSKIFAPYSAKTNNKADYEFPIYSAATTKLISDWAEATAHLDITGLSSAGWLCQCQDWDRKTFKLTSQSLELLGPNRVQDSVRFHIGWKEYANAKFIMVREKGVWKVDDLFSDDLPEGLKAALIDETAHPDEY